MGTKQVYIYEVETYCDACYSTIRILAHMYTWWAGSHRQPTIVQALLSDTPDGPFRWYPVRVVVA